MKARLEPPESDLSAPFWEATRQREFVLQWCRQCEKPVHYPREACPVCLGDDLEWRPASGLGAVYAFTVMHAPQHPGLADRVPYVVALVDLAEGVRMMSNIIGCEPAAVHVGKKVRVAWEDLSDGRRLPVFEPADS